MALDARLPLGVQGVDTTQAVPGMQDAQNNALAQIKQKYDNATTAEKYDVFSTGLGAATVTELAKTNPDAIVPFLEQRLQNIEGRVKQGLASDSNDTKMLLDAFRQNPEQGLAMAQGYLRTAQLTGAFDGLKRSDGGDTGVILDRLRAAAEGRGMTMDANGNPTDDIWALQILKGGAGQAGKNAADINSGRQANYETEAGAQEAKTEFEPERAAKTTRATKTEEELFAIDEQEDLLLSFQDTASEAKRILAPIPEYKLGPVQGRLAESLRDPEVLNLQGIQNTMSLQARNMLKLPASGFSDADLEFLKKISGGDYPSGKSFTEAIDRMENLNNSALARLAVKRRNLNSVNQPAAPVPGQEPKRLRFDAQGNPI